MYIVASVKRAGTKSYTYYNLVEGIRTPQGPRHNVILSLGKLENVSGEQIKLLSRLIDQRLSGQIRLLPPEAEGEDLRVEAERIAETVVRKRAADGDGQETVCVKIDGIEAGEAVLLGSVHVGLEFWRRLGMDEILAGCGFSARERERALVEVIGRLVAPGSELATSAWVRRTALNDLLGGKLEAINKDVLYRVSDRLWAARRRIESSLGGAERRLFALEETLVLYDLTSTYFEGRAVRNPKARRGYSRDRRGDCKQLVVGMVLDEAGFPKASETWAGNTRDSGTLDQMLDRLESRVGRREGATVVMDRGIATAKNVERIRERGYHYIVALAGQSRYKWIGEIRENDFRPLDQQHSGIEVCMKHRGGETYLLVRSAERTAKDKAIRERFTQRLEKALQDLTPKVASGKLEAKKAREKIGRLRQQYQRASRFFVIEIEAQEGSLSLKWRIDEQKLAEARLLDGVYILKTDHSDLENHRLWSLYVMLDRVERSFRYLKTSLGMRPIFHHKQDRADGHIFISILAYHLLHAIEQTLLAHGDHRSWPTINAELQTHRALTVELQDLHQRLHHIRMATRPTVAQAQIYGKLGVSPKPLKTRRYVAEPQGSDENRSSPSTA
jgi:transposase